jgi:hypothetical protein
MESGLSMKDAISTTSTKPQREEGEEGKSGMDEAYLYSPPTSQHIHTLSKT